MTAFQGSGFQIELPDGTVDASSYVFALPGPSGSMVTLVIKIEGAAQELDLEKRAGELNQAMAKGAEDFHVLSQRKFQRAGAEYMLIASEWGQGAAKMCQKQILYHVGGASPRLLTMTATDLAAHFGQTEPMIDSVVRSFKANNIQVL